MRYLICIIFALTSTSWFVFGIGAFMDALNKVDDNTSFYLMLILSVVLIVLGKFMMV